MFFEDYPKEELPKMWSEFLKLKRDYTPSERWNEIIDKKYKNAAFTCLSLDNIIYDFYQNTYNEEMEKTCAPFVCTCFMVILAKKANVDYGVELNLPSYEFQTYFEVTRLYELFDRTRDVSELHEEFKKYEEGLKEKFPDEEITLWKLFNDEETSKMMDTICDDNQNFGIVFIDIFTNILAYDFVKNYLNLPNERDLNDIYEETNYDEPSWSEDECRNGISYEGNSSYDAPCESYEIDSSYITPSALLASSYDEG